MKRMAAYFKCCWKNPLDREDRGREERNNVMWRRDGGRHCYGTYSMAVGQGNEVLEDLSQVVSGHMATFVGIYDGHNGVSAASYTRDHLYNNLLAESQHGFTESSLRQAIQRTVAGFNQQVEQQWIANPAMAQSGTCCLIGIIQQDSILVANMGDSRVVLGLKNGEGICLSNDHNLTTNQALYDSVDHGDIIDVDGIKKIRGVLETTRSIGDLFLKDPRYSHEQQIFYVSSEPDVSTHAIPPNAWFLIFGSDDFWRCFDTNEEVVHMVGSYSDNRHRRERAAGSLANYAIQKSATVEQRVELHLGTLSQQERRGIHGMRA